jgi:nucleotide-binding universal stress UspA family protein
MKSGIIAIDPTAVSGKSFERLCSFIRLYQKHGLFSKLGVVSLMHSGLYSYPLRVYRDEKPKLARETKTAMLNSLRNRLDFTSVSVIPSSSSGPAVLVERLEREAEKDRAGVIILGSHDRSGLPYWYLGSFSETAAFTSKIPVLIVKTGLTAASLAEKPHMTVAVDASTLPGVRSLQRIILTASNLGAEVDLVYVRPEGDLDEAVKIRLERLRSMFSRSGVKAKMLILRRNASIAQTVADHARARGSWLLVTYSAAKKGLGQKLMGSVARKILTLSRTPFLSVGRQA